MKDMLVEFRDLISVLLKAGIAQKKAILEHLDPDQVDFIGEFVYNILNTFPISKKEVKKYNRKNKFKEIANFKKSNRFRNTLIKKHKKVLIDILLKHKDNLTKLIL